MKMKCVLGVFLNLHAVFLLQKLIQDTLMMRLCLAIIAVSGLFAYSSCRHAVGETLAFKSLMHHNHFRICASWRLS